MCGYIEINGEQQGSIMQDPDFSDYLPFMHPPSFRHFYPAFGQDTNKTLDIVIQTKRFKHQVSATWWFDCIESGEDLLTGARTTFNARNLESPYWRRALKYQRAVVFATGIGESKLIGKTRHRYYMQSNGVFALAALYRAFENRKYSCAVITRDAHPKMEPYHDKAFPCFLPMDAKFLNMWLDPNIETHPEIDYLLANPVLYPTLHVQRVKTYRDKQIMKSTPAATLISDIA
ncbi:SOS response-associated peptidase family protein [Glaciecola sp. KUL10]|uniref:SOS response-associated peptidase family protein n=1 Tax=Glaciecola sp. (strain KUL10) TaxID=2161813 RepID=UPI000D78BDF7|nr:SOS response-associated peptidase family protein [Glaciecola sp. KUL10]GBL03872.1 hypothetical protein KUL10_11720 [Glaciecola sp. KUL10]